MARRFERRREHASDLPAAAVEKDLHAAAAAAAAAPVSAGLTRSTASMNQPSFGPIPGGGKALRRQQHPGELRNRLGGHRVDLGAEPVEREKLRVGDERLAEPAHPAPGRLHREDDPALQVLLRALQLAHAQVAVGDVGDLRDGDLDARRQVLLAGADVEADLARCRCTGRRRCRRNTPSRASRGFPGRSGTRPSRRGSRPGARRRNGCRSERAMPGAARQTWYCSVSFRWKRTPGRRRLDERRAHAALRRFPVRPLRGRLFEQPDEALVLDVPRGGDHDVAGDVDRAVERGDRAARDGRDHLRRPDYRPPERVRAEDGLGDEVVDEILRRVLVHRDLLEHDLALRVEVGEDRREDHVRHHVDRGLQVMVGDARVDDRVLAGRGRVQLAAERVEDLGDLLRAVRARSLEEQVLDEVRDAGLRVALVARAGADPEPERDGAHLREALRDDPFARVELGHDVLLSHKVIVTGVRSVADVRHPPGGCPLHRRASISGATTSAARAADGEAVVLLEAADAAVQAEDVGVHVDDLLALDLLRGIGRVVEFGGDLIEVVERVLPVALDLGRRVQLAELSARRRGRCRRACGGSAPKPSPARRSRSGRSGSSPGPACSAPGSSCGTSCRSRHRA